jgi:hypothetical protein
MDLSDGVYSLGIDTAGLGYIGIDGVLACCKSRVLSSACNVGWCGLLADS